MEITYRGRLGAAQLTIEGARELAHLRGEGRLAFEMDSLALVPPVLDRVRAAGISVVDFSLHSPNLSDAFLALTGRSLREPTAA